MTQPLAGLKVLEVAQFAAGLAGNPPRRL